MTIFAIDTSVHTNAALIEQAMTLGYINGEVLDATWGTGRFWSDAAYNRAYPTTNDLHASRMQRTTKTMPPEMHPQYSYDYTKADKGGGFPTFWDNQFGTVIFDPPYQLNGTSTGVGPASKNASYGVGGPAVRWQDRMSAIYQGIEQCIRVLAPGGHLLIKCQDQVVSGKVRWQTIEFSNWAEINGCELVDMMHLVGSRPQPAGVRQVHCRRNYSTLLICKKDKA